jgi:hypothetical protein
MVSPLSVIRSIASQGWQGPPCPEAQPLQRLSASSSRAPLNAVVRVDRAFPRADIDDAIPDGWLVRKLKGER